MKRLFLAVMMALLLLSPSVLATAHESAANATGVSVPQDVQELMRTLFRLSPPQAVDLQTIIILAVIFICFFVVLLGALRLTPFFERGIGGWAAGFVIVSLMTLAGVMRETLVFLQDIVRSLQKLTPSAFIAWGILVLVLLIVVSGFYALFSLLRRKERVSEAERRGLKLGVGKYSGRPKSFP